LYVWLKKSPFTPNTKVSLQLINLQGKSQIKNEPTSLLVKALPRTAYSIRNLRKAGQIEETGLIYLGDSIRIRFTTFLVKALSISVLK